MAESNEWLRAIGMKMFHQLEQSRLKQEITIRSLMHALRTRLQDCKFRFRRIETYGKRPRYVLVETLGPRSTDFQIIREYLTKQGEPASLPQDPSTITLSGLRQSVSVNKASTSVWHSPKHSKLSDLLSRVETPKLFDSEFDPLQPELVAYLKHLDSLDASWSKMKKIDSVTKATPSRRSVRKTSKPKRLVNYI